MRNKIILTGFVLACITSCNNAPTEAKKEIPSMTTTEGSAKLKSIIKEDQLATKRDPVCNMPVYKYLEDTTLYEGKIYGFCGKGCKDEFLKAPQTYLKP